MKILCPEPDSFSLKGLELASKICDLESKNMSQKNFELKLKNFQAALIRFNTKINRDLLIKNQQLKAIISPTTGLDHIDIRSAKELGVKVFHLKDSKKFLKNLPATAELTIGLLISLYRKIPSAFSSVKSGYWNPGNSRGFELSGKIIGIVGFGRLGRKVSKIANSFGMKVVFYDPKINHYPKYVKRISSLNKLLMISNVVSLHVHLSADTYHLISYKEISLLKKNSVIINTSRGAIINNKALLDALKKKQILGAAVDVLEDETSIINKIPNRLIKYSEKNNNLIITPHIGGSTFESVEKADLFVLNRFNKFLNKF